METNETPLDPPLYSGVDSPVTNMEQSAANEGVSPTGNATTGENSNIVTEEILATRRSDSPTSGAEDTSPTESVVTEGTSNTMTEGISTARRYPHREHHPPSRYDDFVRI